MPNKIPSNRVSRVLWMIIQAACTIGGFWIGLTGSNPPFARPVMIVFGTVVGFLFGITLTVVWAMLFELFRFTLPQLVRREIGKKGQ